MLAGLVGRADVPLFDRAWVVAAPAVEPELMAPPPVGFPQWYSPLPGVVALAFTAADVTMAPFEAPAIPTAGDAPTAGRLTEAAKTVETGPCPVFLALAGTTAAEIDPLLAPVDIWQHGPLGDLQRAARAAAAAGDEGRYRELAATYWRQMRTAVDRREAYQARRGRGRR